MELWTRPPRHPEAAGDDPATVSILTTEHFTLQTARSATISESIGRTSTFLSTVSGGLVALSLFASAAKLGPAFVLAAFALGLTLVLLGLTTYLRVLENATEDIYYAQGIARIRHRYLQRAPELEPVFLQSGHDDLASLLGNMSVKSSRTQLLVTSASSVAVVNSALLAALGGGLAAELGRGPNLELGWVFAAALLIGALSLWGHIRYERQFWERFTAWSVPLYPARPPESQSINLK